MVHEDTEDPLRVLLVQNEKPVETFRADGAHESLGDAVGLGRAKRRANDLNPAAAECLAKTLSEFLIAIANQKLHGFRARRQGPRQLPRLLNDPGRAWSRRAPGHVHTAATQLAQTATRQKLTLAPLIETEKSRRLKDQFAALRIQPKSVQDLLFAEHSRILFTDAFA